MKSKHGIFLDAYEIFQFSLFTFGSIILQRVFYAVSAKYTNIAFTKCQLTVLKICQFRDKALEIARIKKNRKVQVKMIRRLSNTFLMEVFSSITIIADFLYHWVVIVKSIAKWPFLRTKTSDSISNFLIPNFLMFFFCF